MSADAGRRRDDVSVSNGAGADKLFQRFKGDLWLSSILEKLCRVADFKKLLHSQPICCVKNNVMPGGVIFRSVRGVHFYTGDELNRFPDGGDKAFAIFSDVRFHSRRRISDAVKRADVSENRFNFFFLDTGGSKRGLQGFLFALCTLF